MFSHLLAGGGVGQCLQGGAGLADEDVPPAGDRPDGLFGGGTLDPPGVTARHAQQSQLDGAGER